MSQSSASSTTTTTKNVGAVGGTPFVWSKLVSGQKTSLADVQATEQQKFEAHQKKIEDAEKVRNEKRKAEEMRKKIELEKEETRTALKRIEIDAESDRLREKYSARNGHWDLYSRDSYDEVRPIPRNINAHALKFAQGFLLNFGKKANKCTTLFQLKTLFEEVYSPYALVSHQRSSGGFLQWEEKKYPNTTSADRCLPSDRCAHLQEWMLQEKKEWESTPKSQQHVCNAPWAQSSLWIFVSNVNWVNFLKSIDEKFGAFEKGILKIANPLILESPIEWTVSLDPYIFTHFQEKPASIAKRQRKREELDDDLGGEHYAPGQWDAGHGRWN